MQIQVHPGEKSSAAAEDGCSPVTKSLKLDFNCGQQAINKQQRIIIIILWDANESDVTSKVTNYF